MNGQVVLAHQTSVFLGACLLGAALVLLYDVFRILRMALPHYKWVVALEDILFWALGGLLTVLFLVASNDGQVRFFIVVGVALGGVLYHFTLSQIVMSLAHWIIRLVTRLVIRPIRWLLGVIWRVLAKVSKVGGNFLVKPVLFFQNSLKRHGKILYNQCINHERVKGGGGNDKDS